MIKDLTKLQPFHTSPGRHHNSFMNIKASPVAGMDMQNFFIWLDHHKNSIAMDQENAKTPKQMQY